MFTKLKAIFHKDNTPDSFNNHSGFKMVKYILHTEDAYKELPKETIQKLKGIGIEIAQCREEETGLSAVALAKEIHLKHGFLILLEEGRVLPDDITPKVWKSIYKIKGFRKYYKVR